MSDIGTTVIAAHVPISLAENVDRMAEKLAQSREWVVEQALYAWLDREQEKEAWTREALDDVDAGNLIDHEAVQAWIDSLPDVPP